MNCEQVKQEYKDRYPNLFYHYTSQSTKNRRSKQGQTISNELQRQYEKQTIYTIPFDD